MNLTTNGTYHEQYYITWSAAKSILRLKSYQVRKTHSVLINQTRSCPLTFRHRMVTLAIQYYWTKSRRIEAYKLTFLWCFSSRCKENMNNLEKWDEEEEEIHASGFRLHYPDRIYIQYGCNIQIVHQRLKRCTQEMLCKHMVNMRGGILINAYSDFMHKSRFYLTWDNEKRDLNQLGWSLQVKESA